MKQEIEIKDYTELYADYICEIAYAQYNKERGQNGSMPKIEQEAFYTYVKASLHNRTGLVALENGVVVGCLICGTNYTDGGTECFYFPEWGYSAIGENRCKVMSYLFQKYAERIQGKAHFEVKLYSHDEEMIQLFSFTQFGIQCEQGICDISDTVVPEAEVCLRMLGKEELRERWQEVWAMLHKLIAHLQESPVFYPGEEFTEDVYKEFFAEENTHVYVAETEGKLIGVIQVSSGENDVLTDYLMCRNVGDVYVDEAYRGSDVARKLLLYAGATERKNGTDYLWVEHGTANPNARGFWNKYFTTYVYTMIRDVEVVKETLKN